MFFSVKGVGDIFLIDGIMDDRNYTPIQIEIMKKVMIKNAVLICGDVI